MISIGSESSERQWIGFYARCIGARSLFSTLGCLITSGMTSKGS